MQRSASAERATPWHWAGLVLAVIVGISYLVIASPMAPDDYMSPPRVVLVLAAILYIVGGYLILRDDRKLLMIGLVANTLVMLAFVLSLVTDRATADAFSTPGKLAQLALEIVLIRIVFLR